MPAPISVGELECSGEKRRFLLMAGVGVDGEVVRGVRLGEKRLVGKGAYLLSALRVVAGWDRGELQVAGGGRSVTCHSVIVCNAAKYGGDFLAGPRGGPLQPRLSGPLHQRGTQDLPEARAAFGAQASGGGPVVIQLPGGPARRSPGINRCSSTATISAWLRLGSVTPRLRPSDLLIDVSCQ